MFGKLTRERYEWHPDRVLCKRFNIANPYPESLVPGVPGGTKRGGKFDAIDFMDDTPKEEPEVKTAEPEVKEGKR